MSHDLRVQQLVARLLSSDATPEEVCAGDPDLLNAVRERWESVRGRIRDFHQWLEPTSASNAEKSTTSPDCLRLPVIADYEVLSELGRGGMGIVFRALHVRLNRQVALKMILGGGCASVRDVERFHREVLAAAQLHHPNIAQIYDVGEWEGRPYYTMEFVEGGNLAKDLSTRTRSPRQAALLVSELAGAVEAAHQRGIIHRDLNPANVLLTAEGDPKIVDFGLALWVENESLLTQTGVALGTPGYMAPEQLGHGAPRENIGPSTDIHGLGAILYELLTGSRPYLGSTALQVTLEMTSRDPVAPSRWNPAIPRDLEIICLKCLHKDRSRRYSSASALQSDLKKFLNGDVISAQAEPVLERLFRRVRRRPWQAATIGLGAAVLTAGVWILSERVAAGRQQEAERLAIRNAVTQDLAEMNSRLAASSWSEARAAKERATGRLGNLTDDDLTRAINEGNRTLSLVADLENIRLNAHERVKSILTRRSAARGYEEAFRAAGLKGLIDDPEILSSQIRSSQIRSTLIAALDHWSESAETAKETEWVLEVARRADTDTSRWRIEARDPAVRNSQSRLIELIGEIPIPGQPVPLLLALEMRLRGAVEERVAYLKRVQRAHPDDFWINLRLGSVLQQSQRPREAVGYFEAANALRPRTPIVLNNLGLALFAMGRREEAVERYREAIATDPTADAVHANLISALWNSDHREDAIRQLESAESTCPESAPLLMMKGRILCSRGLIQEGEEALRRGAAIDPSRNDGMRLLRELLILRQKGEEAREVWRREIDVSPGNHASHYGYAEYCAYSERPDEYLAARVALLREFGTTEDSYVAERTSRACLLQPLTGEELQIASSLADRAVAAGVAGRLPGLRHFYFAQGLSQYRRGDFQGAITAMKGEAASVLGPAPRLVLAMALFRSGDEPAARETLRAAIASYDWDPAKATNQDTWLCHVLRREAQSLVGVGAESKTKPLAD